MRENGEKRQAAEIGCGGAKKMRQTEKYVYTYEKGSEDAKKRRTDKRIKFLSSKCLQCWKILNKGGFYFLIASLPSNNGNCVIPRGGVALPNSRSDLGVPLCTYVCVCICTVVVGGGRGIKIESVYTVFGSCMRSKSSVMS